MLREIKGIMLRTVEDIVKAIGGNGAAAMLAGVGSPAVSNWKAAGSIPARHFIVFSEELERRGLRFERSAFGFRLEEARP